MLYPDFKHRQAFVSCLSAFPLRRVVTGLGAYVTVAASIQWGLGCARRRCRVSSLSPPIQSAAACLLHLRKLRLREVTQLPQGHTAL